jgi:circadian clock protein KaiB
MNRTAKFKLRLYIAGDTQSSLLALANLSALCEASLPNHPEIEVVDVFGELKRALADSIIMPPTLVKLAPSAVQKIVGTHSESSRVIEVLGLRTLAA